MQGCRIGEATKQGPAWDLGFDDPDGPLWPVSERADEYEGPSSPRSGSIECGQYWLMGNRRDSGSGGEGRGGVKMGLPPISSFHVDATSNLLNTHGVASGAPVVGGGSSESPVDDMDTPPVASDEFDSDWVTWIDSERRFKLSSVPQSTAEPAGRGRDRCAGRDAAPRLGIECTLGDGSRHIPAASFAGQVEGMYFGRGAHGMGYYSLSDMAAASSTAQSCVNGRTRVLVLHDQLDSLGFPRSGPHAVSSGTADAHRMRTR